MKLSIIIPVYNVEKYVGKCIQSCIDQKEYKLGTHYEIICVNDGTQDKSAQIIEEFTNTNLGIRLINQMNLGLSSARNTGLDNAIGEYVWFVDSDDWIESDALKHIIPSLANDIDLLQIEYRYTYYDTKLNKDAIKNPIKGIIDGKLQTIKGGLHTPAQFVICRRDFLIKNNLRFREKIYHEDGEFRPRCLLLASKVTSIPNVCYNYFQRETGNIMSNFSKKNMDDLILVMTELDKLANEQKTDVKRALFDKLGLYMNTFISGCLRSDRIPYSAVVESLAKNKALFKDLIKCKNIFYTMEFLLFRVNIHLGLFVYRKLKM